MTARRHGNPRKPNMFQPFEERFAENSEENLKLLKDGTLGISLPYLMNNSTMTQMLPMEFIQLQSQVICSCSGVIPLQKYKN